MSNSSVSRLLLILDIKGKFQIKCDLKRHLAPTLVGKIHRSLPLTGNSHILSNYGIYFETSVDAGLQRARREFNEGDVTFLSVGHAICFFHSDATVKKEMAPIGRIIDDPKLLKSVEPGDEIKLFYETG